MSAIMAGTAIELNPDQIEKFDIADELAGKEVTVLIDSDGPKPALDVLAELSKAQIPTHHSIVLLKPENRGKMNAFLADGFDGYLIKPIRSASLISLIAGKRTDLRDDRETSPARNWSGRVKTAKHAQRILLAEDNQINALLAKSILEKAGHQVTHVLNGEEALKEISATEQHSYGLVLMDLQMPVMDGLDALEEIRANEAKAGHLLTGHHPHRRRAGPDP